jgi:hypothetical protein
MDKSSKTSSNKQVDSQARVRGLVSDLKAMHKAGQIKLAPGNSIDHSVSSQPNQEPEPEPPEGL